MFIMKCFEKFKMFSGISLTALIMSVFLCGCADSGTQTQDIMTQLSENADEERTQIQITETEQEEIYVYVCGAVKNSGVYAINKHGRLFEVIELAGGFDDNADKTCLNLAREAEDGEQIIVLTMDEAAALEEKKLYNAVSDGLVNINTASVSELTTVSGIGESRAQAIIAYRESNGAFKSIEDIKKVDGIKDGLFSKIKDRIKI